MVPFELTSFLIANAAPGESASTICMTKSVMITATIDAHEMRDVIRSDMSNAFVQRSLSQERKEPDKKIIMKIRTNYYEDQRTYG